MQRRTFRDQDPANIKAAELVGRLHDTLAEAGHRGHDLERFLVRVVFCMFADDTGVFEPRDIFLDFIEMRTGEDGADLGPWLAQLFEVLDTPEDERPSTLDIPTAPFLVIPEVSSERREYAPIGWLEPPVIPSNLVRTLENATLADFGTADLGDAPGVATPHRRTAECDYRYSIGLVYNNTFPMPPKDSDLSKLGPLGQAVLDARATHPGATLAELYDPDLMPPTLRRAHRALDRAVDRLYRHAGFASERERVEHLFMLYEKMRAPLDLAARGKSKRRRRRIPTS